MIIKLSAVCLLVENLTNSRDFYEKKLGLLLSSTDLGYVEYKLGETPLALFEKKHAIAMFEEKHMRSQGGVVIALQVDDVTSTCKELIGNGVDIFEGPKTTSWGQTVAYFYDPDGHIVEITS